MPMLFLSACFVPILLCDKEEYDDSYDCSALDAQLEQSEECMLSLLCCRPPYPPCWMRIGWS